jgi:hypothetical protein
MRMGLQERQTPYHSRQRIRIASLIEIMIAASRAIRPRDPDRMACSKGMEAAYLFWHHPTLIEYGEPYGEESP